MAIIKSGNPALSDKRLKVERLSTDTPMTAKGAVQKTLLLLAIVVLTGSVSWSMAASNPSLAQALTIGGAIAGFITALIIIFKQTMAPVLSPLYAVFQGACLGAISMLYENLYDGIVLQAILITLCILLVMLSLYQYKIIKVTEKFRMGVIAATGGVALVYVLSFVLGFFGVQVPYIHGGGIMSIGFSVVVVVIASLNLVLDFDFFDKGEEKQLPKYMEWYGAFGLMVTLIWLYLEILRLLGKSRR
ncbi:MAG: hypothetical protein GVY05_03790 [Bacteroidetes bacterium]|jgi:uncharacterized YccA/Bax inhibitor family protein|nr:hypothetical protein [Bacteroidota bacterium]